MSKLYKKLNQTLPSGLAVVLTVITLTLAILAIYTYSIVGTTQGGYINI